MYRKYLSKIMKQAWVIYRKGGRTFSECLKKAWANCKKYVAKKLEMAEEAKKLAKDYVVRMHYADYKNQYGYCKTVAGSYDAVTKTIGVLVNTNRTFPWER